jgi:AMP-polyphosphate phosphotransferase
MFETAELGQEVDKRTYEKALPPLREALLDAQYELLEQRKFSAIVLVNGVDGAGKGEAVNLLHEWMDPRHIMSHAAREYSDEERARPPLWRYWRDLPPKGKLGVFFGSWYTMPILRRARGELGRAEMDDAMDAITRFERMLAAEGVLLLKLWFHLSKKQQKTRLQTLSKDPRTRWRVTDEDWANHARYDELRAICERALRRTSSDAAPWHVIEGADANYRALTTGRLVLEGLRGRLAVEDPSPARPLVPPTPAREPGEVTLLSRLDLSAKVSKRDYEERLEKLECRLALLTRHPRFAERSLVAVFEGVDAAGKGGAIRRLTRALDARTYRVNPIAAPTDEERVQPYLWRFWRRVPKWGRVAIFDRSWYGRVLVERVEGFASQADWQRAYSEINDFEEQLSDHGAVVVKLWLHIDQDEQERRFRERAATGFKRFKITEDDWRNRSKWPEYEAAANEMFERTSTEIAPWTLVAANDKRHARLLVLETICDRLEAVLAKKGGRKPKKKKG